MIRRRFLTALLLGSACPCLSSPAPPAKPAPAAGTVLLKPGRKAPDFVLPAQDEKTYSLMPSGGRWTVLAFYPKDMTFG